MLATLSTTARRLALLASLLLCLSAHAWATSGDETTALVAVPVDAAGIGDLGLALDHVTHQGDRLLFAANAWERAQLDAAGIAYEVRIADLEGFYAERLRAHRSWWAGAATQDAPGFGLGSMGGFYTWDEVVDKLDEMHRDYPTLASTKQSLGLSHEGREIWMVKISDNVESLDECEPAALFTGLTHGNEPMGMEVCLYTMFFLLENYGTDPEVTYLVDQRELYFVPVVNPDGYVRNQTTHPSGGGMWRKNRRDSGAGVYGVDLNRNYGYLWGYDNQGSSPNPSASTYRGPGPFSEPETTALRSLHQMATITTAFHYHAYGGYQILPYAYVGNAFPAQPDYDVYLRYGSDISAMNGHTVGNFFQTLKYLANGEVIDWSWGEQLEKSKVMAFLPEVGTGGDGFWPTPARLVTLVDQQLQPNLYWAWMAGARADLVQVSAGPQVPAGTRAEVVVEVENRGYGAPARDLTVTLETADPYVSIATPTKAFPMLQALEVGDNAGDPLEFLVSPAAPVGQAISLTVTLRQGAVLRGQSTVQVTTQAAPDVR
jgi:hypothetical protein